MSTNPPTTPVKIPLVFYSTEAGNEPVRDWLLGGRGEPRRDRARLDAGAMALAGRDAAGPGYGKWIARSENVFAR